MDGWMDSLYWKSYMCHLLGKNIHKFTYSRCLPDLMGLVFWFIRSITIRLFLVGSRLLEQCHMGDTIHRWKPNQLKKKKQGNKEKVYAWWNSWTSQTVCKRVTTKLTEPGADCVFKGKLLFKGCSSVSLLNISHRASKRMPPLSYYSSICFLGGT